MTGDRICEYFIEKDNNCAEVMLRALNDEYCLGTPDDSVKLVGGSRGGVRCGKMRGALCGGRSAISYRLIHERVHATSELKPAVAAFAEEFVERFGPDVCYELVKTHKKENIRCPDMVCMATDTADVCFERIIPEEGEQSK